MIAGDDVLTVANLCADHLRHEHVLLEAILPMLRGIQASFGKIDFDRRADESAEQVAQLIEMMNSRRQKLRQDLAPWLGIDPRRVTLSLALRELPDPVRAPLQALLERVRTMVEELIKLTYWVALHLRVHLDTFQRLICDLTGTSSGSGRYGPYGAAEAPAYRPLFQIQG